MLLDERVAEPHDVGRALAIARVVLEAVADRGHDRGREVPLVGERDADPAVGRVDALAPLLGGDPGLGPEGALDLGQHRGDHGLADVVQEPGQIAGLDVGRLDQRADVTGQDRDRHRVLPHQREPRRDEAIGRREQAARRSLDQERAQRVDADPGHRLIERGRGLGAEGRARRRLDDQRREHRIGLEEGDHPLEVDVDVLEHRHALGRSERQRGDDQAVGRDARFDDGGELRGERVGDAHRYAA